ncbi:MAG: bifunctional phosphoribosyl-AMP cyclohydrolase/phosphoribosyl-ATP diphosphatase HisIE [Christensenellales bacterium]
MDENMLDKIKFDEKGLVCAVAQDVSSKEVLMVAYMNRESIKLTMETGYATYYSRSRQELWVKGQTSGNKQKVVSMFYDCDGDCLLLKVEQKGVACHTGQYSCFFEKLFENGKADKENASVLYELYGVIQDRKANPKEGSYTNYLFDKGLDKILKKVGEEASEIIIAAKNASNEEMTCEISDFLYHLLVAMVCQGVTLEDIFAELKSRR